VLVPALVILSLASAFAIWHWPGVFIAGGNHNWLIAAQLLSFVVYLTYTRRYFRAIAPLILRSRKTI
jgi:hypothetical protein